MGNTIYLHTFDDGNELSLFEDHKNIDAPYKMRLRGDGWSFVVDMPNANCLSSDVLDVDKIGLKEAIKVAFEAVRDENRWENRNTHPFALMMCLAGNELRDVLENPNISMLTDGPTYTFYTTFLSSHAKEFPWFRSAAQS